MTYTSVAQIYEEIDGTRERLYERFEGLSDEQASARANMDAWSIAEIAEHLSIMEIGMLRVMKGLLAQVEAGGEQSDGATIEMKPFSLEEHLERARKEKYVAPEIVRPKGTTPLADSLARLRRSREELRSLRPRIEATDCSAAMYPHPAFGPLSLYQWLAFIGHHEERHLRQAEAVLNA